MTQLEFDELQKQAREKERESAQAILREANALRDEYKKKLARPKRTCTHSKDGV